MKSFVAVFVILVLFYLFVLKFPRFQKKISGLCMLRPEAGLKFLIVALFVWEDTTMWRNIWRSFASIFCIPHPPGNPVSSGLSVAFSLLSWHHTREGAFLRMRDLYLRQHHHFEIKTWGILFSLLQALKVLLLNRSPKQCKSAHW